MAIRESFIGLLGGSNWLHGSLCTGMKSAFAVFSGELRQLGAAQMIVYRQASQKLMAKVKG